MCNNVEYRQPIQYNNNALLFSVTMNNMGVFVGNAQKCLIVPTIGIILQKNEYLPMWDLGHHEKECSLLYLKTCQIKSLFVKTL